MCRVKTFFFNFPFFFPPKISVFFNQKKEKKIRGKKIAAARVAIISATSWTGNNVFLRVA